MSVDALKITTIKNELNTMDFAAANVDHVVKSIFDDDTDALTVPSQVVLKAILLSYHAANPVDLALTIANLYQIVLQLSGIETDNQAMRRLMLRTDLDKYDYLTVWLRASSLTANNETLRLTYQTWYTLAKTRSTKTVYNHILMQLWQLDATLVNSGDAVLAMATDTIKEAVNQFVISNDAGLMIQQNYDESIDEKIVAELTQYGLNTDELVPFLDDDFEAWAAVHHIPGHHKQRTALKKYVDLYELAVGHQQF